MSEIIGIDRFNRALGKFIDRYRYKHDPYPNIGQFISTLREETPEDLQYLITDTFEKITLYENKAKSAKAIENSDGTYNLHLEVEAKKVYSDSLGAQTTATLNDWLEIGVIAEKIIDGNKQEIPYMYKRYLLRIAYRLLILSWRRSHSKLVLIHYINLWIETQKII